VITDSDPSIGQLGGAGFFNRCFHATPSFGGSDVSRCPTGTVLIGNTFDNNPGQGLSIDASIDATVIGNSAHGNGFGTQTYVDEDPPFTDAMDFHTPPCDTITYQGNDFGTVSDPCIERNVPVKPGVGGAAAIHQALRPGGRAVIQ
ncbi:MAG TPA: hypothetical protein VFO60_04205, partial [Candidatus Dormibacteraeota bacterium]|nr:hypothetical protein [Candidatus Dormibacteraeota bacterium]